MSKIGYCHITIDENGKKKPDFGKTWGQMKKKKANASFMQTGDGMYVIDIDSKKIPKKYKTWVRTLGSPTVETKRGYHYYVKSDVPITNHQNIFNDDKFKVDVRGKGGLVFTDYWGDDKNISYLKTGKEVKDKKFKIFKSLPKSVREPKAKREVKERDEVGKVDLDKIKRDLNKPNPKDYQDRDKWLAVLASVYHGGGVEAEKIARKWSKQDKKSYDKGAFDNVWSQLERGKYGEDISYGTLMHEVNGEAVEPTSLFKVEEGNDSVIPKTLKQKKKELKKRTKELKNKNFTKTGLGMTEKSVLSMVNQEHLFDGIVVSQMHTVLYGGAGTNKTTLIGWICTEILQRYQDKNVHFWSFDASNNHNVAMFNYAKKVGVLDRMEIISSATSNDHQSFYDDAIEAEADLSGLIIVNDTLKFLTKDVNSKSAMKETMHYMKELQTLGATIVTLAHSNKDGLKQSGTAELEQDSDGILRIERSVNDFDQKVTLSVKAGGRCRFNSSGTTFYSHPTGSDYEYLYSAMETMSLSDTYVPIQPSDDITQTKKVTPTEVNEVDEIKRIIGELNADKKVKAWGNLVELETKRQEKLSGTRIEKLLRDYNKKEWTYKMKKKSKKSKKPEKLYTLI